MFVDFLYFELCSDIGENISVDLRSAWKDFTTKEYDDKDYPHITLLKTIEDYESLYKIIDVQVNEMRSVDLVLGLNVYCYRKKSSDLSPQCCFRGYWDGNSWSEYNMDE